VKRFSSGMYVRLAFAVAAHLEPEILIIDEVLAVGDAEFQKKCVGKMNEISKTGRTVLFVSHNMSAIRSLCRRGFLLSEGNLIINASADDCVRGYEGRSSQTSNSKWLRGIQRIAAPLAFESISLRLEGQQPSLRLVVDCTFFSQTGQRPAIIAFDITDSIGTPIMQALPSLEPFITSANSDKFFRFCIALPPVIPGNYRLSAWVGPHNLETYDFVEECVSFDVCGSPTLGRTFPHTTNHGFVVPASRYEIHAR